MCGISCADVPDFPSPFPVWLGLAITVALLAFAMWQYKR
jgi:hypothetical protein